MNDTIVSLTPSMKKRLNFKHDVLDMAGDYKLEQDEVEPALERFKASGSKEDRDILIMGYLWLAKDLVCRLRGHFPETLTMTEDLASESLAALTEFVTDKCSELDTQRQFFGKCQQFIHNRLRAYVNDNRSLFSASARTNDRRKKANETLEYNFTTEHNDELNGSRDYDPCYVDVLDSIEALADVDREEMQEMIMHFLQHDHDIAEADLSDDERAALEKLSKLGEDLL